MRFWSWPACASAPTNSHWAIELAEVMLQHFEDRQRRRLLLHGRRSRSADQPPEILRRRGHPGRQCGRGARAAAAGIICWREPRYLAAAERTLRAAWPALLKYPRGARRDAAGAGGLSARRPQIVVLRGPARVIEPWRRELNGPYSRRAAGRWRCRPSHRPARGAAPVRKPPLPRAPLTSAAAPPVRRR